MWRFYIVDGEKKPLLRKFLCNTTGNWTSNFTNPQYVSVKQNEIYDIDMYITDKNNNLASFLNQPVTLTLHFKSYPFF